MFVHSIFATPVCEQQIPVQSSWLDCLKGLEYAHTGYNWISKDRNIWLLDELSDLKAQIQDAVEHYAYQILNVVPNIEIDLVRAWSVKHNPGDSAKEHCHTNAVWSGVYYLNVSPSSGEICFNKDIMNPNCFLPTLEPDTHTLTEWTSRHWYFTPVPGSLLIFPSQLKHSVEVNESDDTRYCIGFDVFVRGTMGQDKGSTVTV